MEPAAVLSKSKNATLTNLKAKEKSMKTNPTTKNVLCQETMVWPRPEKDVEDKILSQLTLILQKEANIFKLKSPSEEQKEAKVKIRSQLAIGVSSVFRGLEKDSLSAVLVSGQATPAVSVDHVIGLARERGCPLLCLDQLAPSVALATESKCLPLAVGFKIIANEEDALFDEVVEMVKKNTTVRRAVPADNETTLESNKDVEMVGVSDALRPLFLDESSQVKLLDELERLMSQASATVPGLGKSSEKRQRKKNRKKKQQRHLKSAMPKSWSHQFEIGKRTVQETLARGSLQLILISDGILPFLYSEANQASHLSLLQAASKKAVPVVCLPGLAQRLNPVLAGSVSVFAIKKLTSIGADCKQYFDTFLKMFEDLKSSGKRDSASGVTTWRHVMDSIVNTKSVEEEDKTLSSSRQKYVPKDYSYLYILKKDSKDYTEGLRKRKASLEKTRKEITFSSDFISLSSEKVSDKGLTVSTPGDSSQEPQAKKLKVPSKGHSQEFRKLSRDSVKEKAFRGSEETLTEESVSGAMLFSIDRGGDKSQSTEEVVKSSKLEEEVPISNFSIDRSKQSTQVHEESVVPFDSGHSEKSGSSYLHSSRGVQEADGLETVLCHDTIKVPDDNHSDVVMYEEGIEEDGGFESFSSTSVGKEAETSQEPSCAADSPKEENLEHKMNKEVKEVSSSMFSLDRAGCAPPSSRVKDLHKNTSRTSVSSGQSSSAILGDLVSTKPDTGFNILAMHQPRPKGNPSKKKALNEGGFISFAYNETNIKTMVADVSKKKKKKKKK